MIALASINWFCKSRIPTTFYFLREQAIKTFTTRGETYGVLSGVLGRHYPKTCLICDDMSESSPRWSRINTYSLKSATNKFNQSGVVLKEIFAKTKLEEFKDKLGARGRRQSIISKKMLEYDVFTDGLIYDFCTMTCILHIATYLGYKNIIFVGVDLYDHRYFWLPENALRGITRIMGRGLEQKHHTAKYTCELVAMYKKVTGKNLYTFNPDSLLKDHIAVYDISLGK